MNIRNFFRIACMALLLVGANQAMARVTTVTDPERPRQLEGDSPVSVSWDDPADFTEIRYSGNRWEAQRGNWVMQLAEHLRKQVGKALPEGQRVEIHITDIDLAGDYRPGQGMNTDHIRMMRDIYPPRMRFDYTRYDANGQIIAQGERKLSDMGYLSRSTTRFDSDKLAYEKRMIDEWVRREMTAAGG